MDKDKREDIAIIVDDKDRYIKELKAELEEANDNATWWRSRYKAAVRMANGSNWNKLKKKVTDYRFNKTGSHEDGRYCVAISVTDLLKWMEEIESDLRDE